nr:energy transducer TonB [uncultured Mucilaginibacter sp.]
MKRILVIVFIFLASFAKAQHKKPRINVKDTTVYTVIEQQPQFGKEEGALGKYIMKNLLYHPHSTESVQGHIIANFVVEKDGSLSRIKILRPKHTRFERLMIALLKAMPKWRPAIQNGYIVRCEFSVPIGISWASED